MCGEALKMLTKQATTKDTRKEEVKRARYLARVTLAGWLWYNNDKVRWLTLEALHQGFNHFKMKVGSNVESDLNPGEVTRSIIDDPANLPKGRKPPSRSSTEGKNAGPTGNALMIDANKIWDVPQAVEYVKRLAEIKPGLSSSPLHLTSTFYLYIFPVLSFHSFFFRPLHHMTDR